MKNNNPPMSIVFSRSIRSGFFPAVMAGLVAGICAMPALSSVSIDQRPPTLPANVPGNLFLVPSVEYPTIDSPANLGNYDETRRFTGYFDSGKCYLYHYSSTESERHFYPSRKSTNFTCANAQKEWSGNYLNWLATQTIDPFRSALTGGYRVRDLATETWLEKARHARDGLYPQRSVHNKGVITRASPAQWGNLWQRIQGLGNKVRFTGTGNLYDNSVVVAYNPAVHVLSDVAADWSRVYEISIRVKVCDPTVGVEANCKQYSQGWKPEGLIQEYSSRIRYSIFGFLNETGNQRNGGVMRARQKFVGPETYYPEEGTRNNLNKEWNPDTGIIFENPDPLDAGTIPGLLGVLGVTSPVNSGVINYLNKFGQITSELPKGNDPVSELYYAMFRYVRGDSNLSDYSSLLDFNKSDGFPVITAWDDPIRYSCQVNAALGIGDVYTHMDHDLPAADKTLAETYTNKIFALEGINKQASADFSGRGNSAYIAGLSYYAHTNDLRPDSVLKPNSEGMQSLATYWVDVRENATLEPKPNNQYWLAAKYGSFRLPLVFDALATSGLPQGSWHTSGEYLTSGQNGGVTNTVNAYPRPDGFYVASEADKMVQSLRRAFEQIAVQSKGSATALAQTSTKLEAGAYNYQASYSAGNWSGQLTALKVDPDTGLQTIEWTTDTTLTGSATINDFSKRKLFYNNAGTLTNFIQSWTGNVIAGTVAVNKPGALASLTDDELRYLLGDRSKENQYGGDFRDRGGMLGDIVNSQPLYVAAPLLGIHQSDTSYGAYASQQASRTPVIYVGANDGMLHAFNAGTGNDKGKEIFAFMPTAAMDVLKQNDASKNQHPNWSQDYSHVYSVDGEMTVADVKTVGGQWKTILVGTLGRGGKSVYALDVTNPASPVLLWEKSGGSIGNVLGKPIIAKVADGDWRVFFGNGPNSGTSSTSSSAIVVLDVLTGQNDGTVAARASTTDGGLGPVQIWDADNDGNVDTAYAGDMGGSLWKLDLRTNAVTQLFTGAEPITAQPLVARNPNNPAETWVFFGTGRYLSSADSTILGNLVIQRWIGLIDGGSTLNVSSLEKVAIQHEDAKGRVIAENAMIDAPYKGWYIELRSPVAGGQGERMVLPNQFKGQALIGTSMYPAGSDVCKSGGGGHVMAVDPFTGGRLKQAFFDVDGSGLVGDAGDKVGSGTTGGTRGQDYSGIALGKIPGNSIFRDDMMYIPQHDGTVTAIRTSSVVGLVRRVSWRELLNEG